MGLKDVVKNTSVAISIAMTVISGENLPSNLEKQYAEWAKLQAVSWVCQSLTEGEIYERAKSKATSMKK